VVPCGDLLWRLRHPSLRLLGTAYYHPVLPLIPAPDREEHLLRWRGIGGHLFQREFPGFWPPEMAFCMEMIPLLAKYGYRYVFVDSEQIVPITPMRWEEIRYRPHLARFGDAEIVVIPRDRALSIAQEGGMDVDWFLREVEERTRWCAFPPLVCTATDGDNGGWFRNVRWESNFWGAFYRPLCDQVRSGQSAVRPVLIDDYLDRFGAHGEVLVRTGAWNTGAHNGVGFVQWTGSKAQQDALARIAKVSLAVHNCRWTAGERGWPDLEQGRLIEEAMWRLLRAETSCNLFWGEAWVHQCHQDLDGAEWFLRQAEARSG
jgi:alpha-amylase/alpha-mannosidase (GH57 family)